MEEEYVINGVAIETANTYGLAVRVVHTRDDREGKGEQRLVLHVFELDNHVRPRPRGTGVAILVSPDFFREAEDGSGHVLCLQRQTWLSLSDECVSLVGTYTDGSGGVVLRIENEDCCVYYNLFPPNVQEALWGIVGQQPS